MTTIAAAGSPSHSRSAICRMYTDVQASGSIHVVLSLISTAGTRCCWASASAAMTAASASTTASVRPARRTRQANRADHRHRPASGTLSHQPEICLVAASTATAVNRTAPPRRSAIAYQPASQFRAWSDGPANRWRPVRPRRPAEGWTCPPAKCAAESTGPVCGRITRRNDDVSSSGAGRPTWVIYPADVAADMELIGAVRAALRGAAQPELAGPMQSYMKSATPYLGVRVPVMRALTRAQARLRPFAAAEDVADTVLALWRTADFREERYAAIALLDTPAARRLRDPGLLETQRELIVAGAWWDYVDELAHRVGELLAGWPDDIRPALVTWARGGDMWLRRASIICQLGAGDRTDLELFTLAVGRGQHRRA